MRFTTVFISLIRIRAIFSVDGGSSLLRTKNSYFDDINEPIKAESLTHSSSLAAGTTRSTLEEGSRLLGDARNDFDRPLFERSVTMQGPGCQNVMWTVDRETLKITFRVESSEGADWVGFGLSENGGMKGADIAIVRRSGSEFIVEDRVSIEFDLPKKDTLQNVELLSAEIRESDQRIVAIIRRDLQTCDLDDLPVEPNKQYLICASGMTSSEGEILYHGPNVANAQVNLMLDEDLLFESKFSAGNFTIISNLDSIKIPADPEGNDYSIQFMIPGAATREHVPTEGLQVLAAFPHMRENGLHARLQLIRDGIHILDPIKTLSFDFDRQTPTYKQWKLLPGDSLLATCTYRPHPEHDIHGGYSTQDEMCQFFFNIVTPRKSNATFDGVLGVGYAVKEGEPLKKSFLGPLPVGRDELTLDPKWATYAPSDEEVNFKPIKDHRTNICELALMDTLYLPVYSFAEYNITGMITMIVTFCFCAFLGAEPVWKRLNSTQSDERLKRNTIVYIGQLIYGTFALIVTIVSLIEVYRHSDTFDAVEPKTYVLFRGTMVVQALLYLLELFYRIEVRLEVVLHHVLCAVSGIFSFLALSHTFSGHYILEVAALLFMMAVTEHPLNLTLLLKNLGYAGTAWWPKLCKASGVLFILAKIVPFGLFFVVMVRAQNGNAASTKISDHSFSEWLETDGKIELRDFNIFVPILFSGLMLVQLYIGYVLWVLGCRYEEKNRSKKVERDFEMEQEEAVLVCDKSSPRDETQNFDADSTSRAASSSSH